MCLMLLATCCEDDVVPHVLPFIKENIKHPDWRYRDASVMAFGSILEGPELNQLKPLVIQVRRSSSSPSSPSLLSVTQIPLCTKLRPLLLQAMPTLIELMKDPSVVVRDTTAWTVGRICELLPEAAINEVYLAPLLQCLIEGLGAEPRVASNVCWVSRRSALGVSPVRAGRHVAFERALSKRTRPQISFFFGGNLNLSSPPSGLFVSRRGGVRSHGCRRGPGGAEHLLPVLVLRDHRAEASGDHRQV